MHHDDGLSLNVWFRDDIKNALVAVDSANLDIASVVDTPEVRIYRRGYEAAIRAVAAAFGIRMEEQPAAPMLDQVRPVRTGRWLR